MPDRVPNASVIVVRDGKRVQPPLHKAFSFTDDEIAYINTAQPGALRVPINETPADDGVKDPDDSKSGADATSKSAPDGSKKATAEKGTAAKVKTDAIERGATGTGGTDAAGDDATDEDEDEDI